MCDACFYIAVGLFSISLLLSDAPLGLSRLSRLRKFLFASVIQCQVSARQSATLLPMSCKSVKAVKTGILWPVHNPPQAEKTTSNKPSHSQFLSSFAISFLPPNPKARVVGARGEVENFAVNSFIFVCLYLPERAHVWTGRASAWQSATHKLKLKIGTTCFKS